MNKRMIVAVVVVAVAVTAALVYFIIPRNTSEPPSNIENVGGKYNATIGSWTGKDYAELEYTDETGTHSDMYFSLRMRNGLDWIKNNTPENVTFLCWWEDGHMIKGYAERNVVLRNPSQEILDSVANPSGVTEFDAHERIFDVVAAFTANNTDEMVRIIEKYDATCVHVSIDLFNRGGSGWIYTAAGLDWTHYLARVDSTWEFTDAGRQTMFAKLIENRDTGLTLVYQDKTMKVYRRN